MGLFDINEEKLKALYYRAWKESGMKHADPRKFPYLNSALIMYAKDNKCSYDKALVLAMSGKKLF